MPSIKHFIEKRMLSPEIMNELEKEKRKGKKINRTKMFYKEYQTTYEFSKFKTIRSFEDAIRNGIITVNMANNEEE